MALKVDPKTSNHKISVNQEPLRYKSFKIIFIPENMSNHLTS